MIHIYHKFFGHPTFGSKCHSIRHPSSQRCTTRTIVKSIWNKREDSWVFTPYKLHKSWFALTRSAFVLLGIGRFFKHANVATRRLGLYNIKKRIVFSWKLAVYPWIIYLYNFLSLTPAFVHNFARFLSFTWAWELRARANKKHSAMLLCRTQQAVARGGVHMRVLQP